MRIGIDCSLVPGNRTGIGQYCHQLVHALSRVDHDNQYLLYPAFYYTFHPHYRQASLPQTANMRVAFQQLSPFLLRVLRHSRSPWFIRELLLGQVDIVHGTSFSAPRLRNRHKRLIMTIYDLSFLVHPEFHREENVRHALQGTREAISRADAIIAISHATRQELIDRLNAPADRIVVTQLAAGSQYVRIEDSRRKTQVREKYQLPPDFILCVGSIEPRKNIARLLEAYARLTSALQKDVQLVIAGGTGWLNTDIYLTVCRLGLETRVHFIGYVEENDLPVVYSLAEVFVYPSLYEGFGLPVLEAMQCGVPVLTSTVSSLPEVAGDAALLVTPTEVDDISQGLRRLLENADLRAEVRARGYQRAREFSWERCARETLAVYKNVYDRS
jgi:glycosyltransferase involved in cell wall biosynthesis